MKTPLLLMFTYEEGSREEAILLNAGAKRYECSEHALYDECLYALGVYNMMYGDMDRAENASNDMQGACKIGDVEGVINDASVNSYATRDHHNIIE